MAEAMQMGDSAHLKELTADVVAAYVGNNAVPVAELPALIGEVYGAFGRTGAGLQPAPEPEKPVPAVPIRKSVTDDFIVCLEDGKRFKSLRRHLMTHYGMTPEAYRAKWGLPADYPMVAPNYAAARSALAKASGLGSSRRRAAVTEAAPEPAKAAPKRRAPRKVKAAA